MLMSSEFGGGFARMGKNNGQSALIGQTDFDRMVPIKYSRHQADGWRDPMRRQQPAEQQQHTDHPNQRIEFARVAQQVHGQGY